jgi:UDP-N-acetyl-D-galactosamine dehydrogenase
VVDIVSELKEYNINVDIMDPWCSSEEALHEYGLSLIEQAEKGFYDAIFLAVGHNEFKVIGAESIRAFGKEKHVLYDLKHVLDKNSVHMRL